MELTITVEVFSDRNGELVSPIKMGDQTINQLGLYAIGSCKVWIVPMPEGTKEPEAAKPKVMGYVVRDNEFESYFTDFTVQPDNSLPCGTTSAYNAHVFKNKEIAEKVVAILSVLHADGWEVIPV